jgi:anti-sigma factor RsiW
MSHPDEGVLQELLDGELAPADEAVVRAHIAGCTPCTDALAALKAAQLEADAIVSRLVLEPPLRRTARRPWPNLRLLGLAASAVLVAGTSWLLLRSPASAGGGYRSGADTSSGVVLPMPTAERQEVAAATPARPARPVAPVAEALGREDVGSAKGKSEKARLQSATAARSANAVAARDEVTTAATTMTDAEARVGGRLLTIAGLTPQTVEVEQLASDSVPRVRQTYVVDGVPVVLVQYRAAHAPAGSALVARDEMTQKQRAAEPEKKDAATAAPLQLRSWQSGQMLFQLQGALPADSLDALMQRVR